MNIKLIDYGKFVIIQFSTAHSVGNITSTKEKIQQIGGQQAISGFITNELSKLGLK